MYQIKLVFFIFLLVNYSSQSPDLLDYHVQKNQEISYFSNYYEKAFYLINQTLEEFSFNQNFNSTCFNHIQHTIKMAKNDIPWAVQMFDSMGKPTSGLMQASFSFLGLFSECIDIKNNLFNGQYCLATISLSNSYNIFKKNSKAFNTQPIQAKLGICAPNSCSINDITLLTNNIFNKLFNGSTTTFSNCYQKEINSSKPTMYFICFFILSFIISLVIIASIYDYYLISKEAELILNVKNCQQSFECYSNQYSNYLFSKNNDIFTLNHFQLPIINNKLIENKKIQNDNLFSKILLCFSAINNGKKLFDVSSKVDNSINCLDGIKFICMLWTIIGHSYSFAMQWLFFSNPNQIKEASKDLLSQIFANGTFSVDVFFFISGLLVCLSALRLMKKWNGKFNLILFYFYRYLRIAPLMLILIAFSANIFRTLAEGPVWLESITMYDDWCKENWWLNVFQVHNFIKRENMCFSHSWYSAVDMQFYLISPLILIPLYKKPKLGLIILTSLLTISVTITASLTYINDYPAVPYMNGLISLSKLNDYYGDIYIKPYCRIGPYLIGMLVGFLIYKKKTNFNLSKTTHLSLTLTCITTILAILFSMQSANNGIKPSIIMATLYSSLSRTLFCICIAYFILCFINNKFKLLNLLLSAKIIRPFSRVSYDAYLVHPLIMAAFYGSRDQAFVFSNYLMIYFIIGHLFFTYTIAFFTAIAFEMPFINLSKIFLNSSQSSSQNSS